MTSGYLAQSKEDFGEAYVQAVAAGADCWVQTFRRDYDGVDGQITRYGSGGSYPDAPLRFQLKTTQNVTETDEGIRYALPVDNYEKLRARRGAPAVLIVVVVPPNLADWIIQDETELTLLRAGYWVSLEGRGKSANRRSTTVTLPRNQLWTVEAVRNVMDRVVEDAFP